MKIVSFEKGLNDYFFGIDFESYNWKHFGEVESGSSSPDGPYMCYSYAVYSLFGILFIFGKGEHNHDRYLIGRLK